ncbi:MAG: flagellar basal body rod protein FlgC [Alphaproteobacteria bacterium]|nr:flagellar basal body rod protein FlgC [Alphaproteobacteria bacterium]
MSFEKSMFIAASGMKAQGTRLRVIAENIANSGSVAEQPDGDPYRRRMTIFQNILDREMDARIVKVKRVREDMSDFGLTHDPSHPAANADGYVKTPNVNTLVEMMDMREAQRSYEANLNMIDVTKSMLSRTLDLLR